MGEAVPLGALDLMMTRLAVDAELLSWIRRAAS